jgi:beclin 1
MQDSTLCQRCHQVSYAWNLPGQEQWLTLRYQPLVLDPTIANLSPSSATLITSALPTPSPPSSLPPTAKLSSLPPSSRQSAEIWASVNGIPLPPSGPRSVAESYILLSDSILPPRPTSLTSPTNHQQHQHSPSVPPPSTGTNATNTAPDLGITDRSKDITANLHAILSSRTPISHPICVECTALLQSELQRELEELSRERDAYIEFQKGIVRNKESLGKREMVKDEADGLSEYGMEGTEEEWDELVRRKNELSKEEDKLKKILAETERELEKAHEEEKRVDKEEREQEELEKE